jgi:hypothetical protein
MHSSRARLAVAILIAAVGVSTAALFARGHVVPAVLGCAAFLGLAGWAAGARARVGPPAAPVGGPRPATVPPDGHVRFTVVVDGLDPDRIARVWADLCRPDRPPTEDLRVLFRTFTVVEGRRFRFLRGDPAATAALLARVLGTAAGTTVRTHLEPAAERTAPWS